MIAHFAIVQLVNVNSIYLCRAEQQFNQSEITLLCLCGDSSSIQITASLIFSLNHAINIQREGIISAQFLFFVV